ncbi:RNA-directed DNA polymerase, eukaryota, reverse transcriptase zinc-binding domain protein [Tanacetum coccineum]
MFFMINIYGPQEKEENFLVWNRLLEFIRNHEGQFVLFGDMNEVRDESERYGTMFSQVEDQMFNSFIDDVGLLDLPLEGRSFTWMNKVGTKMSKLDRFLVSNSVMDTFLDLKVIALPRGYTDHIPLMLHYKKEVMLKLIEIEEKIDNCSTSDEEKLQRLNLLKESDDLTKLDDMDMVQKARI